MTDVGSLYLSARNLRQRVGGTAEMTMLAEPAIRTSIAWRTIVFAIAWLIVAGPVPAGWLIGLPTVALATWASLRLAPPIPYQVSIPGLLN